jgi:hypothetical protein
MTSKIYGLKYMEHKNYDEWITWHIYIMNLRFADHKKHMPIIYSRYEDLASKPVETMETLIRFVTGVPIEFTGLKKKLRDYIAKNGLTSAYKSPKSEKKMDDGVPENRKGMSRFLEKHVREVYEGMKDALRFFGYASAYEKHLNLPVEKVDNEFQFQKWNKAVLESVLKYQYKFEGEIERLFWIKEIEDLEEKLDNIPKTIFDRKKVQKVVKQYNLKIINPETD